MTTEASKDHESRNFSAVIFDCDGVLVDSERIGNHAFVEALADVGLPMSFDEVVSRFSGMSDADAVGVIEGLLGRPLPDAFWSDLNARVFETFRRELQPVPGIVEALDRISLPMCVASSSTYDKMKLTLGLTGLLSRFEGRLFSATEVQRGKPSPDLFLYAARQMGFAPDRCAVVEDSVYGVQAGVSAGMTVFGYAGGLTAAETLARAGAHVFGEMIDLPHLLGM